MYDYVIVGAGSAGCVLANRLTENPSTSVLLLEAGGPDKRQEIHIPVAFGKLYKTPLDWAYETVPQSHLNNRKLFWPRGKMLGGSSSMNAMIYIRGNRLDYDQWQAAGNQGWGYEDVLPYFIKSEHQERGDSKYHGHDGPLNVTELRSPNPLSRAFVEAGVELGLHRNNDFNGPEHEGIGLPQVTQKRGMRWSTADAFLRPALKRPNLTVVTDAMVRTITFEQQRATGVVYVHEGQKKQAQANREVILCGGAINSPQLLLLSGIGPANQLEPLGIKVVANLSGVGQNLQDHLHAPLGYYSKQPISLANAEKLSNLLSFILFKRGQLTSNLGEGVAFLKTREELKAPNLELIFAPALYLEHGFVPIPGHGFGFGSTLLSPESSGYLALRSSDPNVPPIIQPNYLEQPNDLALLIESVKLCRRLAHTHAFDPFRDEEYELSKNAKSDDEIANYIRDTSNTVYHPVGTCKMGNDKMAVVDSDLRVHGIDHLRVVDASIMPSITRGHTNAPVIMIAEKAADIIKKAKA